MKTLHAILVGVYLSITTSSKAAQPPSETGGDAPRHANKTPSLKQNVDANVFGEFNGHLSDILPF
ncbi:hypothetical protein [Parapedobacter tibetensis]|uniref:hypothetical protein n=1 Tax=Parapedobacter tibetensis TaxID=2972951 RepID=UPI00214DDAB3|nr:hypothetical protein [Parapedobacter tibetensis]